MGPERRIGYLSEINDEKGHGFAMGVDGEKVFIMRRDFRPNDDGIRVFPCLGTKIRYLKIPARAGKTINGKPRRPQAIDIEVLR